MPDIFHDFVIKVPPARVFTAVSAPPEIDQWWTVRSAGEPRVGAEYELGFGPGFDWHARVTVCEPGTAFEIQLTRADEEWAGSRVGFQLQAAPGGTQVRFHHRGWPTESAHYRVSCYCWAMYLRVLRRYLEHGEQVPYERRLEV